LQDYSTRKNQQVPTSAQQIRWCLAVNLLGVEIRYEPGKKNVVADALSQMKSINDKKILATKLSSKVDKSLLSRVVKEFLEEKISTIDGIEYFVDGNTYRKLISDINEKVKLILEAHCIGHEGYNKTYQRLRKCYYWNNMVNDIKRIISKCQQCQLSRPKTYPEPIEDIPTKVEGPFTRLDLDIIGPLEKTSNNNKYILVIVDFFTKWVEDEPTENVTSKDVIKFLINAFSRHSVPQTITFKC